MVREDGPLSHLSSGFRQIEKRKLHGKDSNPLSDIYMGFEDRKDADAILNGIDACAILTGERAWETQGFADTQLEKRWSPTPTDTGSLQDEAGTSASACKSVTKLKPGMNSKCPFAGLEDLPRGQQAFAVAHSSTPKRPNSLPTPPELREEFIPDPSKSNQHPQTTVSPPPSATGSASKCPIRYLDERSPEEVARYFESHKHEIPRSHEVCVKRYQSNEESIRQLDAKYGSLVSMIQGLGVTHKPLLPAKEEDDGTTMEHRSMEKVEEWAENVKPVPEDVSVRSIGVNDEERQGHFDRPLGDIRVGESPSRPWGIRVPIQKELAPSASISLGQYSKQHMHQLASAKEDTANISNKATAPYPSPLVSEAALPSLHAPKKEEPRMLFTGPVFIGYSAEQAADLIKRCGMGVNIPGT